METSFLARSKRWMDVFMPLFQRDEIRLRRLRGASFVDIAKYFKVSTNFAREQMSVPMNVDFGRADYNGLVSGIEGPAEDREPVFLIRSSDQVGHLAVRAWASIHRANGGSDLAYTKAMAHADLMEQWGKTHGSKAADCPPEEKHA